MYINICMYIHTHMYVQNLNMYVLKFSHIDVNVIYIHIYIQTQMYIWIAICCTHARAPSTVRIFKQEHTHRYCIFICQCSGMFCSCYLAHCRSQRRTCLSSSCSHLRGDLWSQNETYFATCQVNLVIVSICLPDMFWISKQSVSKI